jgi:hypothetical protein
MTIPLNLTSMAIVSLLALGGSSNAPYDGDMTGKPPKDNHRYMYEIGLASTTLGPGGKIVIFPNCLKNEIAVQIPESIFKNATWTYSLKSSETYLDAGIIETVDFRMNLELVTEGTYLLVLKNSSHEMVAYRINKTRAG